MKKIYFLFVIAYLGSCTQKESKSEQKSVFRNDLVTIKYDFDTVKAKFNFLYLDRFDDQLKAEFNGAINPNGSYPIKSSSPVFLLDYSINQTYYIVYPNDTLKIKPSSNIKSVLTFEIENGDLGRQSELLFFEKLAKSEVEDADFIKRIKQLAKKSNVDKNITDKRFFLFLEAIKRIKMENTAEAFQSLTAKYSKRKKFLIQYDKDHQLSVKFKDLVSDFFVAEFEAEYFQLITLALERKKKIEPKIDTLKVDISKNVKKDTSFFIPSVVNRLKAYLNYNFLKEHKLTITDKMAFIDINLEGKVKAHAKFLTLKMMSLEKNSQELSYLNVFAKSHPQYLSYINENLLPQNVSVSKTMLKDEAGRVLSFDDVLNQYKGKVVLLDFWASWCSPCIAEFPSSKTMQENVKLKDVVFIYLSIDENFNIWKKSESQFNLGRRSYLIQNHRQSELAKRLKVESIPRYVIVNPNGDVVNSNADRPSSGLLEKQLMGYLKK